MSIVPTRPEASSAGPPIAKQGALYPVLRTFCAQGLLGQETGLLSLQGVEIDPPSLWAGLASLLGGVFTLTLLLHVARLTGRLHGVLAKHVLVAATGPE